MRFSFASTFCWAVRGTGGWGQPENYFADPLGDAGCSERRLRNDSASSDIWSASRVAAISERRRCRATASRAGVKYVRSPQYSQASDAVINDMLTAYVATDLLTERLGNTEATAVAASASHNPLRVAERSNIWSSSGSWLEKLSRAHAIPIQMAVIVPAAVTALAGTRVVFKLSLSAR